MPGSKHLGESKFVQEMIKNQWNHGRWVAAICAAPVFALKMTGLLDEHHAVCFSSLQAKLEANLYTNSDGTVPHTHIDKARLFGKISSFVVFESQKVSGRGPASAQLFGLTIVEALCGSEERHKLEGELH